MKRGLLSKMRSSKLRGSPPPEDVATDTGATEEDEFDRIEDPMRWAFLPSTGVLRGNTKKPVATENEVCKMQLLAMHRPTHEAWREDTGKYRYHWHFSGRRRLWEIRLQIRFKKKPTSTLYFGLEMRYIPFTLSYFVVQAKNMLLKAMSTAIGGEIYQTPGEDPASTQGEAEPPTFAMPLWAIDQFHVADPGQEPDLTGDLEGLGLRRTGGLQKYIKALKEELANLSTEKVYTFCFWGISQFADAINWEVRTSGFKLDASKLCGLPPVNVALYEMPGVTPDQTDRRHLVSRKLYYTKVAVWSSLKPHDEQEVKALYLNGSGEAEGGGSSLDRGPKTGEAATPKKSKGLFSMEWLNCCAVRDRDTDGLSPAIQPV